MTDTAITMMTPLGIFNAIESLTDAEKEMPALFVDEKFSAELIKRRRCRRTTAFENCGTGSVGYYR